MSALLPLFRLTPGSRGSDGRVDPASALPAEPCAVLAAGDAGLRVVALPPPDPGKALCLQPVRQGTHPVRLLALAPAAGVLRVNGVAAPRLAVLHAEDFVQWGPDVSFTVELARQSVLGPAPAEFLGRPCPICRVPFDANAVTFTCGCGALLHCEESADKLQCAQRARVCPSCRKPLALPQAARPGTAAQV